MIGVVKANAYGFGAIEIAKQLVALGCEYPQQLVQEGIALRKAGIEAPIMVFHYPLCGENIDRLVHYRLEPALYSTAFIAAFKTTVEASWFKGLSCSLSAIQDSTALVCREMKLSTSWTNCPNFLPTLQCVFPFIASENEQPCAFLPQRKSTDSRSFSPILNQRLKQRHFFIFSTVQVVS